MFLAPFFVVFDQHLKKVAKSFLIRKRYQSLFFGKVFLLQLIIEAFAGKVASGNFSKDFRPHRNCAHGPIWLLGTRIFCRLINIFWEFQ